MDVLDRFYDKVQMEPNSGCWLWDAACVPSGYGYFYDGNKNRRAHRFSYEVHIGPIPDGLQLDHLCRVRCCVNPQHLQPVTQQENLRRGISGKNNADKTHCPSGHPYSGDNLSVHANGGRRCLECRRKMSLASYYKRRNSAAGAA